MKPISPIVMLLIVLLVVVDAGAETHRFVPTVFRSTYSAAHPPTLRVKSGDTLITQSAEGHAAVGPFLVEGAEPGDLLVVAIDRLEPSGAIGYSSAALIPAAVEAQAFRMREDRSRLTWAIDKDRGVVRLDLNTVPGSVNWRSRFGMAAFEMPLRPMLGAIGLAPAGSDEPGASTSGPFGGNLQATPLGAGARVMLPVFQPGALLFLGHGLARKGDGSVTGAGIETPLEVQVRVEVVKKKPWPHSSVARPSTVVGEFEMGWPRIETDEALMAVGGGSTLQVALQRATTELHHWLDDDFGLNQRSVSIFLGQAIEYEIASLAEPHFTVVAKVRKAYLPRVSTVP
jgi:amidase